MKVGSTDFIEDDDFIEAKPQIALDTLNKLCFQSPVCRPRTNRIWGAYHSKFRKHKHLAANYTYRALFCNEVRVSPGPLIAPQNCEGDLRLPSALK
jgi:hypothetical protein